MPRRWWWTALCWSSVRPTGAPRGSPATTSSTPSSRAPPSRPWRWSGWSETGGSPPDRWELMDTFELSAWVPGLFLRTTRVRARFAQLRRIAPTHTDRRPLVWSGPSQDRYFLPVSATLRGGLEPCASYSTSSDRARQSHPHL